MTTIDGKKLQVYLLKFIVACRVLMQICGRAVSKDIMDMALKLPRNYFAKRVLLFHIRGTKNT